MAHMTVGYYEQIKDYLHPHINQYLNHYRSGNIIDLPPYHGCNRLNRCGTRKEIEYNLGYQCVISTYKTYWKKRRINTKADIYTGQDIWQEITTEIYSKTKVTLFSITNLKSTNIFLKRQCGTPFNIYKM